MAKYKTKTRKTNLKEPQVAYKTGTLGKVFKVITAATPEKMDEERRMYSASLSHIERMAYLFELNQLAFGKLSQAEIKKRFNKTIIIGRP